MASILFLANIREARRVLRALRERHGYRPSGCSRTHWFGNIVATTLDAPRIYADVQEALALRQIAHFTRRLEAW
mgnify:CR=1 FL=1